MSQNVPDRPPTAILIDELAVPRNATIGAIVGIAVAAALYLVRVFELLGPVAGTRQYPVFGPEGWFLLLAFVLAVAVTLLVTIVLTVVTAYRLTRTSDE